MNIFQEDDMEWYLFQPFWNLDHLAVNHEGEVVLADVSHLSIIDKSLLPGKNVIIFKY